jgi:class 3 adenylate cyclase/ActR/RegA family two-component response regulator
MPAALLRRIAKKPKSQHREVWIIEDDIMMSLAVSRCLAKHLINFRVFNSVPSFMEQFESLKQVEKLLLFDYFLDDTTAIAVVEQLKSAGHKFDFMVMTGRGDEHLAVEIMKAGALDYLIKTDRFLNHLPVAIEHAFEQINIQQQLDFSRKKLFYSLERQKRLNARIMRQKVALEHEQTKTYKLLTNVLPAKIARELITKGTAKAKFYPNVSVLFADVQDFSSMTRSFEPIELVQMLDDYFSDFDKIIGELNIEKIKTIGDCYMCAGGIPEADPINSFKVVIAGLQMAHVISQRALEARRNGHKAFDMRIGIHTGEVVAGVVGQKKFAYDIWGDAANTASWVVHAAGVNKVNISKSTYSFIRDMFECEPRGNVPVKNNKLIEMFFVNRILPVYSADDLGIIPNTLFWQALSERAGHR